MRTYEIIIEKVDIDQIEDIGQWQLEQMHNELVQRDLALYESFESSSKIKNFLSKFEETPVVGEIYMPMSISSIPAGNIINVACSSKQGELLRIAEPNLFFDFGKGEKSFPYNLEGGDNFRTTILSKSVNDQDQFYQWLILSLSDWRISRKEI